MRVFRSILDDIRWREMAVTRLSEFTAFLRALLRKWQALILGGVVATALTLWQWFEPPLKPIWYGAILLLTFLPAVYLTWREEHRRAIGAEKKAGRQGVATIQRDQKMRDDLHRDLLKSVAERMKLPPGSSRIARFRHAEVIIHRIDDNTYPNIDERPGISGWFKLEVLDFYHGGLHGILDLQYALFDDETRKWCFLSYEQSQQVYSDRFSILKIFTTGKIPWRNILHYDLQGDEYYRSPHLYCEYADSGQPYEGFGYFQARDGYQWELPAEDKMELETLLRLPQEQA